MKRTGCSSMLNSYSAASIENKLIKPPQMIVEDMLPVGLTVLAGHPKLGKSFLSLLLCCCVATGEPFLERRTNQGEVLYLDLEGSPFRTQTRLNLVGMGFPVHLQIVHDAPKLGNGLIEALDQWWAEADLTPRLVVIDTLTRIRNEKRKGETAYDADSKMFAPLQKFALEKKVGVLLVTHLRKSNFHGESEDWLERITGSMGLSGASDNLWGLFRRRNETTGLLRTSSRDLDAGDMILQFDNGLWKFVSDDVDAFTFEQKPIIKFLESVEMFNGSASELCKMYISFCDGNNLSHGLADSQPATSFGKQLNSVKGDLWRIKKTISSERKKEGMFYSIGSFSK